MAQVLLYTPFLACCPVCKYIRRTCLLDVSEILVIKLWLLHLESVHGDGL